MSDDLVTVDAAIAKPAPPEYNALQQWLLNFYKKTSLVGFPRVEVLKSGVERSKKGKICGNYEKNFDPQNAGRVRSIVRVNPFVEID